MTALSSAAMAALWRLALKRESAKKLASGGAAVKALAAARRENSAAYAGES